MSREYTRGATPVIYVYLDKLEKKFHRSAGGTSRAVQDKLPDGSPAGKIFEDQLWKQHARVLRQAL